MAYTKIQKQARQILINLGWGEDAIKAALEPTHEQAEERAFISTAPVNPEQAAAIQNLHREGWGSHSISQAIPATEAAIARVISLLQ